MEIVARSGGVACAITLATRLDPHKSVNISYAGIGGRANAETSVVDIAPVTPSLTEILSAVPARVDDKVGGDASVLQLCSEGLDVGFLVPNFVILSDGVADGSAEGVVVSDVGGETTDGGRAGTLEDLSEQLSGRAAVGRPAEPAGMTRVEV